MRAQRLKRTLLVGIGLFAVLGLIYLSAPYPTRPINLAVGQKGSSYDALGQKLAAYFKEYGLRVNLIETTGMSDSVSKLDDDNSAINAAFMTAGQAAPTEWSGLVSLGSVQYSPLWLLYRGDTPKNELELFNRKIAIGADDTNTQALFKTLANTLGYNVENQPNLLKIKHAEAVERFNAGEIDAIFIVDGINSDYIRKLLGNPQNHIYNFRLADAYTWQIPYLNKLTIPEGGLSLPALYPASDINLLSTSMTLLVEENTHPYVQWLLLKAIRDISNGNAQGFAATGFFPARLDSTVALSHIAERYYDSGFPELAKYMPLWLAVYLDRFWVILLSFLAVILPLKEIWGIAEAVREKARKDQQ